MIEMSLEEAAEGSKKVALVNYPVVMRERVAHENANFVAIQWHYLKRIVRLDSKDWLTKV